MLCILRCIGFTIFDPRRTAGGDHRQGSAVLQAVQKLGSFLHDRQIGREIGIEYLVKSQALESRHQTSCADNARLFAQCLRQRNADGRSHLDNQFFA